MQIAINPQVTKGLEWQGAVSLIGIIVVPVLCRRDGIPALN